MSILNAANTLVFLKQQHVQMGPLMDSMRHNFLCRKNQATVNLMKKLKCSFLRAMRFVSQMTEFGQTMGELLSECLANKDFESVVFGSKKFNNLIQHFQPWINDSIDRDWV